MKQILSDSEAERADLQTKLQRRSEEVARMKEEIQSRLGPVREEFRLMFAQRNEARKVKTQIQKLESAVKILQTQIENQKIENAEKQRRLEKLQKSAKTPSESGIPRPIDQLFRELWSVLLRKGLNKRQIRSKLTCCTRTEVETWVQTLVKGTTQRERGRMTMQAVRSGKVDIGVFMELLERYQPYPQREDVQMEVEGMRVGLAWQDVGLEEVRVVLLQAGNSLQAAETAFQTPPFSRSPAVAKQLATWLTRAGTVPANYSELLQLLPVWPLLKHISAYVQLALAKDSQGFVALYVELPIPCSESSLQEVLIRKLRLTQEAAGILACRLCATEGGFDVEEMKRLLNSPVVPREQEFEAFLGLMDDDILESVLKRSMVLPSSFLAAMTFVSSQVHPATYLSLSDFLGKCEECGFTASPQQRWTAQVQCFLHTLTVDALDARWLREKANYVFLTSVRSEIDPLPPQESE